MQGMRGGGRGRCDDGRTHRHHESNGTPTPAFSAWIEPSQAVIHPENEEKRCGGCDARSMKAGVRYDEQLRVRLGVAVTAVVSEESVFEFTTYRFEWLNALNASARSWSLKRSLIAKFL